MSRLSLASTRFLTGPSDTIAEKGAYDVDGKSVITDVRDIATKTGSDVIDAARNTPGIASKMAQVVAGVKNGRLTQADGLQRVMGVLGGNSGVLTKLTGPVQSKVLGTLGIDSKKANEILIAGENTYRRTSTDITRTSDVMDVYRALTGNSGLLKVFDIDAESTLIGGLIGEMISLGIPEAIDALYNSASSDYSRYRIAYDNIEGSIYSGDIATITKLIDRIGAAAIVARFPNFCRDFMSRYHLPLAYTADQYPVAKADMIAMFLRISSTWDKALRGVNYIQTLVPFSNMSEDARTVFMSTPSYQVQVVLAKDVGTVEVNRWIKENYPYYPG